MKKSFLLILIGIITVAVCLLVGCSDESPRVDTGGEVSFSVKGVLDQNEGSRSREEVGSAMLVSIEDDAGQLIHELFELRLVPVGEGYISESFSLPSGGYRITQFLVTNSSGEVILATPAQDSELDYLVANPLPVEFSISSGVDLDLSMEVVSTDGFSPDDLGYASFDLTVIGLKHFKVFSTVANALGTFPEGASLEVQGKNMEGVVEWIHSWTVVQGMTITVPAKEKYTFSLMKDGHVSHIQHYHRSHLISVEALYFELIPEGSTDILQTSLFDGTVKLYYPTDRAKLYLRADLPEDFDVDGVFVDHAALHAVSDIPLADPNIREIYSEQRLQHHSINLFGNVPFALSENIEGQIDMSLAACCATDYERDVKVVGQVVMSTTGGEIGHEYFDWDFDEHAFRAFWCPTNPIICE